MAGNLNTAVTVDATQLRSGLALAQQDVKSYGAAVRAAAADIKTSGTATAEQVAALDKASAAFNKAKAEASDFRTKLGEGSAAARVATAATNEMSSAHHGLSGSAGVAREALVMLHETIMGNYKRLAGSTMVMAERTNALHAVMTALSPAMMGAAGAAAALAAGFAYLVVQSMHAETALRGVYNAALLQGRGAAQAEADTKKFADQMVLSGTVGRKAATEISSSIQSIPGVAEDVRAKLSAIAPALFEVWGQDAEKTTKNIDQAFRSIGSLGAFLSENRLLTTEQERAFKQAEATKDAFAAQRIGIDALTARLGPAYAEFKQLTAAAKENRDIAMMAGPENAGMALAMRPDGGNTMPPLRMPDKGSKAEDETTRRQTEAEERYLGVLRERQRLESDAAQIQARLSAATTDGERAEAQEALKVNAARQAGLKDQGDASWAAKVATDAKEAGDAAVVAAHNAGQSRLQIMEAATKAEMAVYQAASHDMTRTDAERLNAKRQALMLEMSLIEKQSGGEKTAAHQALETRIAELSAEQAANHDNFAAVMALEDQKLALLKAGGAAYTKQYQEELKRREDMTRQHTAKLQQLDLENLTKGEEIDREKLGERRADLDAEVSDHLITKQVELADLRAFAEQKYQIEHTALQEFIDNNTLEVAERTKALKKMELLEAQHAKTVAELKKEMAAADRQTATATERQYQQMFSTIGSSGERAMAGLIMETTTWQKAEQTVASSVVQSAIGMGAQVVERWAATEIAKTLVTDANVAKRVAAEQAAGSSGFGAILASWLGLESSKDAASAAGATSRAATDAAATTASVTAAGVADRLDIAGAAAVAAANAFALGSTGGPAVAAAAAASAYSATMSLQAAVPSLAVGTWQVPGDMMANIHQGEMIIPAFQAAQIRSGQASIGGGPDAGGGGDIHIHGPLVSAIDTQSGASFLLAHMPTIARGVAAQQSRNPSTRPNF